MTRLATGQAPEPTSHSGPGPQRLTFNLGREVYERAHRAAAKQNITMTEYIRRALGIQLYLDEHDVEEVRIREAGQKEFDRLLVRW